MRMTDSVTVSVIIPVYNIAPYVDKCIESVVGQTYSDIEILIMEGKSTDGSFEKVEAWSKKDERIRLVSRKDGGLAPARNYAVEMARGKYICFLDGDDWIAEDYIEKAMEYARDDVDLIMTSFVWHHEYDGSEVLCNTCCADGIYEGSDANEEYLLYGNHSAWGKLIRRDLLYKHDIQQPKLPYEDLAVYPAITLNARKIASANQATLYYRTNRPGSLVSNSDDFKSFYEVMKWAENLLRRNDCYEKHKDFFALMMYRQMHVIYKRCIGVDYVGLMRSDIENNKYFAERFLDFRFLDEISWSVYGGFSLRWITHRMCNGYERLVKHFAHVRLTNGAAIPSLDISLIRDINSDYILLDFMNEFEGSYMLPSIDEWKKAFDVFARELLQHYGVDRIVIVENYYADSYMENGKLISYEDDVTEKNYMLGKMYRYAISMIPEVLVISIPKSLRYTDVTWQVYDSSPDYGNPYAYGYVAHRIESELFVKRKRKGNQYGK